jgi:hypothetical protein
MSGVNGSEVDQVSTASARPLVDGELLKIGYAAERFACHLQINLGH